MISVEEARATILREIALLGTERVDILSSLQRVIAEDIHSSYNIPPLDNSAVDGYAVRFCDIQTASEQQPVRLKILGDLPAGSLATQQVGAGETFRIMTGAPIPPGADTVVMQEDTAGQGSLVDIFKAGPAGVNIRRAGEDIKKGDCIVAAGTLLRPAHIGTLASIKKSMVTIYQQPRIAILSTGDELVDVDEELGSGQIVNSNSYSLNALVRDSGAVPLSLGIARDTKEELMRKFSEALHTDMIISSGGVSVGDYDYVKDVLQEIGLDMKFWKVAMRPGQPLAFGMIGSKPVFGLPGNPVSAMVSFEQFVRPSIRKMSGHTRLFRPVLEAVALEAVSAKQGRKYFVRCRVCFKEGRYVATTTGEQGSGILMSMAKANGLIIIPEEKKEVKAGESVCVQILDNDSLYAEEPGY